MFVLILMLGMVVSYWLAVSLLLLPVDFFQWFNLPGWLILVGMAVVFAWYFGD